jgi:hypothetical protein
MNEHAATAAPTATAFAEHREAEVLRADLRGLRDVGDVAGPRAHAGVSAGQRRTGVWFDDLVTDWSVRSRIKDQIAGVEQAAAAVREALGRGGRPRAGVRRSSSSSRAGTPCSAPESRRGSVSRRA